MFDGEEFSNTSSKNTMRGAGARTLATHGRAGRRAGGLQMTQKQAAQARNHKRGAQAALDLMERPMAEDRPTTRKDIVALERSVDSITAFAEHIRAGDHAAVAESPLTQKAMQLVTECSARYSDVEVAGGVDGWSRATMGTFAAARFEQQFVDLILGQLEAQLTVTCLEQGRLLRKLRTGYARSFWGLVAANDDALSALRTVSEAMASMSAALEAAESDKARALDEQREEFEAEFDRLNVQMELERKMQQEEL